MNIIKAIIAMEELKKVRRSFWGKDCYIQIVNGIIRFHNGSPFFTSTTTYEDVEAKDWEIYESSLKKKDCSKETSLQDKQNNVFKRFKIFSHKRFK